MDLVLHEVPEDSGNSNSNNDNNAAENFARKVIAEGLQLGRELQTYFLNRNPDTERSWKE